MFVVIVKHPNDPGAHDREGWMAFVAGRWWDVRMCKDGTRILKWFTDSLDCARGMADALKSGQDDSVHTCVREASDGK